jgi:NADH-quinone oxidoreductase subunit M
MILIYLIAIPIVAGLAAWLSGAFNHNLSRLTALFGNAVTFVIALTLWFNAGGAGGYETARWLKIIDMDWIPQAGINIILGIDGLSLLMILLTSVLGMISVVVSWTEIKERVGFFHFNLMWSLAGIIGVFMALNLFLFYFLWELMLVPMYFLIAIWGHERRRYASIKFFLFTQLSGLLMLAAIVALALVHQGHTGHLTFDYFELLKTDLGVTAGRWLMLGFLVAFAVKLPVVPLHTWLPDAHTEAPTAGSVILAGLLLKTGAYGLIRFVVPFFPEASEFFAAFLMILAVIGIIYGAVLAFAQQDLKRLVAYTSISHLGFVLLGIFSFSYVAYQGAVMQMICHGFSTGGLFILAGMIQEKTGTRDIGKLGGLWKSMPRAGGAAMFLAMASLGLPGMGNFIGEFLVLIGSYGNHSVLTILAAVGLVPATIYSLWLIQRTFHGRPSEEHRISDIGSRHIIVFASMIIILIWLGLYPQRILNTAGITTKTAVGSAMFETPESERHGGDKHAAIKPFSRDIDDVIAGGNPD